MTHLNLNLVHIATRAVAECERQHVGLERLHTLLAGYEYAVNHATDPFTYEFIMTLGGLVEPDNQGRSRITPVTFTRSVSKAANHAEVDRLLGNLITYGDEMSAEEWLKQFLFIHPFVDGNGRTAWVLYQMLKGTLEDPLPLPYFDF